MKRLLPAVLSGALAVSFAQFATAQSVGAGVRGPASTGADVNIDNNQHGTQNSSSVGSGNTTSSTTQSGEQNQNATTSDEDRYGDKDRDRDRDAKHENQGKHKGWSNNKHRDESSGSYQGSKS